MLDAPELLTKEEILAEAQRSFAEALPRIEGLASAYLRMSRSERKDESIAEVIAISWKAYRTLALKGEDVRPLLGRIVEFAARRVRSGGRLVGMNTVKDVMSPTARFRHGHTINSLPLSETEDTAREVLDALQGDTSPADQAVVNADFEAWLETLDDYRRDVATKLSAGLNTVDVARTRGVTRARIAQVRVQLIEAWAQFSGDRGTTVLPASPRRLK